VFDGSLLKDSFAGMDELQRRHRRNLFYLLYVAYFVAAAITFSILGMFRLL
jgi:hypothetical protein